MSPAHADGYDVAIVGFGPVGQTLALMLGARGYRILVLEQQFTPYGLPRACHFDHEALRIFQSIGMADAILRSCVPARHYHLLDADGELLSSLPRSWETPSGWEPSYHFYQPDIEDQLSAAVAHNPHITVCRGSTVKRVVDEGDGVRITVQGPSGTASSRARFLIGADGANSTVRSQMGIEQDDLGFEASWVVVDVRMREGHEVPDIPDTAQICDPTQPTHMAWLGGPHLRWELMLANGEDPVSAQKPEYIWPKIRRWITPDNAELLRCAAYTFRSLVARRFCVGHVLLAGDAAHVMPPFLGQGLVSGLRDAATLTWMLDRVLAGTAPMNLLEAYSASRYRHVTDYIEESIRIGRIICVTDPEKARARDAALMADPTPPEPFRSRVRALVYGSHAEVGQLSVQPSVHTDDGPRLLDDVLPPGFRLLTHSARRLGSASTQVHADLKRTGVRKVLVLPTTASRVPSAPHQAADDTFSEAGHRLASWFEQCGLDAVMVRPDGYIHSVAAPGEPLDNLVKVLAVQLSHDWLRAVP